MPGARKATDVKLDSPSVDKHGLCTAWTCTVVGLHVFHALATKVVSKQYSRENINEEERVGKKPSLTLLSSQ